MSNAVPLSSLSVLLPADGSSFSLRAAQEVLRLSQWLAGPPQVHLLHVAAPIGTPLARSHLSRQTLDEYYADVATQAISGAQALLTEAGLVPAMHHAVGDAAEQIVAAMARLQPGLVVMGTHGRSGLAGVLLGSVAQKVLAQASVPVLLVR